MWGSFVFICPAPRVVQSVSRLDVQRNRFVGVFASQLPRPTESHPSSPISVLFFLWRTIFCLLSSSTPEQSLLSVSGLALPFFAFRELVDPILLDPPRSTLEVSNPHLLSCRIDFPDPFLIFVLLSSSLHFSSFFSLFLSVSLDPIHRSRFHFTLPSPPSDLFE